MCQTILVEFNLFIYFRLLLLISSFFFYPLRSLFVCIAGQHAPSPEINTGPNPTTADLQSMVVMDDEEEEDVNHETYQPEPQNMSPYGGKLVR